jgi:Flp pilus assembly CpaF family ATPase
MSVLPFPSDDEHGKAAEVLSRSRFLELLGPLRKYLDETDVTNVDVTGAGLIFVERFGEESEQAPETMPIGRRIALIRYLASSADRAIDSLHSRLACDMPWYDVRVQSFCPPVGNWPIMLRKHAARVYTLDEYVEKRILSAHYREAIGESIRRKDNLLIAGAMSTGKTTFLNACLHESYVAFPNARLVGLQDRRELKPSHLNCELLLGTLDQAHHETNGAITRYTYEMTDLLADTLRTNAGLLVYSELRDGPAAFGLILALNTGTRGLMATVHADSCLDTLERVEDLIRLAKHVPSRRAISRGINVVVFMEMTAGKRRVADVQRVRRLTDDNSTYETESI